MKKTQWQEVKQILMNAMETGPAERNAFLDKACQGRPDLRSQVDELLALEESSSAIDQPSLAAAETQDNGIGPYRILETIGQGGMGIVYLVVRRDDPYERHFALKALKFGHIDETAAKRFHMEGNILVRLNHPFLAALHEAGSTQNHTPYLVMEYVRGVPISEYCAQNGLDLPQRIDLFRKVCDVVSFAHRNLIVHRDLKPSNILVTPDGTPKLLDFGIAKLLATDNESPATMTATGFRAMTPGYASHEQIHGDLITTACDIYSWLYVRSVLRPGTP